MNTARKGARVENRIRDALGARGFDVIRSAASKGGADIVAFDDEVLLLVQVKATQGTISPAERTELLRLARRAGPRALAIVAYTVPNPGRATEIRYKRLTGQGPKDWVHFFPGGEFE